MASFGAWSRFEEHDGQDLEWETHFEPRPFVDLADYTIEQMVDMYLMSTDTPWPQIPDAPPPPPPNQSTTTNDSHLIDTAMQAAQITKENAIESEGSASDVEVCDDVDGYEYEHEQNGGLLSPLSTDDVARAQAIAAKAIVGERKSADHDNLDKNEADLIGNDDFLSNRPSTAHRSVYAADLNQHSKPLQSGSVPVQGNDGSSPQQQQLQAEAEPQYEFLPDSILNFIMERTGTRAPAQDEVVRCRVTHFFAENDFMVVPEKWWMVHTDDHNLFHRIAVRGPWLIEKPSIGTPVIVDVDGYKNWQRGVVVNDIGQILVAETFQLVTYSNHRTTRNTKKAPEYEPLYKWCAMACALTDACDGPSNRIIEGATIQLRFGPYRAHQREVTLLETS